MTSTDESEVRTSCYMLGWEAGAGGLWADPHYAQAGDIVVKTEYNSGYTAGRDALAKVRAEKALEYGRKG